MRKVFLSVMLLQKMQSTKYISDDYELCNAEYGFPLSYILQQNVQAGDEVEIITVVERGNGGACTAAENYEIYKTEAENIVIDRQAKVHFTEITVHKEFDSLTFNRFFKEVAREIKDDDRIYADITFGMKPYSLSMFIALAYASKAAENVYVDEIIYAMKYSGTEIAEKVNTSKIYDLTGLYHLNNIAGNAVNGQKNELDKLLNFIIQD